MSCIGVFSRTPLPPGSPPAFARSTRAISAPHRLFTGIPLPRSRGVACQDACVGLKDLRVTVSAAGLHPSLPRLLRPPITLCELLLRGPGSAAAALPAAPRLGDFGARALAGPLRSARGMRKLCLDGNGIGEEGARALAWAMQGLAASLEEVSLRDNRRGLTCWVTARVALPESCCVSADALARAHRPR